MPGKRRQSRHFGYARDNGSWLLLFVALSVLLIVFTQWYFVAYERYINVAALPAAIEDWQSRGEAEHSEGSFELSNAGSGGVAALTAKLPRLPTHALRVQAIVHLRQVTKSGRQGWQAARIHLTGRRNENQPWQVYAPVEVFSEVGSRSFQVNRVVTLPEEFREFRLALALIQVSGSMQVESLHLQPVRESQTSRLLYYLFIALWVVWGCWFVAALGLSGPGLVSVCMVVLAGAFILLPQNLQLAAGEPFYWTLDQIGTAVSRLAGAGTSGAAESSLGTQVQNLTHFLAFLLLATVLSGKNRRWTCLLLLVTLASATESAQNFVDGRTPGMLDWLKNLAGIGTGFLLRFLFQLLVQRITAARRQLELVPPARPRRKSAWTAKTR